MVKKLRLMYQYFSSIEKRYYVTFFCLLPIFIALGAYLTYLLPIVIFFLFAAYVIAMGQTFLLDQWNEGDRIEFISHPMGNTVLHSFSLGLFIGFILFWSFFKA